MEFILVTCAVLHHLACWHALFHHGMYNCQWQPVCVRIKCCSNTSTHVQFIQAKTHFSTIEHKRHGQQHCNAQKCKTISFMFLWLKTHFLCVDSLVGSVGVCSYAHVVCSTSYTPLVYHSVWRGARIRFCLHICFTLTCVLFSDFVLCFMQIYAQHQYLFHSIVWSCLCCWKVICCTKQFEWLCL